MLSEKKSLKNEKRSTTDASMLRILNFCGSIVFSEEILKGLKLVLIWIRNSLLW